MLIDLVGERFGRLIVVRRAESNRHGQTQWWCRCDCGVEKISHGASLRKGWVKSCGCLRRELGHSRTATVMNTRKHGKWNTPEYRVWRSMVERCKPKSKDSKNYYRRGIYVCDRWLRNFSAFLADMGTRPSPKHSIERKRNEGPYEPNNCEWATAKEQQRNTRYNRMVTIGGRTQCVAAWAEEAGVPWDRLYSRLVRGWPAEELLDPPRR